MMLAPFCRKKTTMKSIMKCPGRLKGSAVLCIVLRTDVKLVSVDYFAKHLTFSKVECRGTMLADNSIGRGAREGDLF